MLGIRQSAEKNLISSVSTQDGFHGLLSLLQLTVDNAHLTKLLSTVKCSTTIY